MTNLPLSTYFTWLLLILVVYLIVLVRALLARTTNTYEFLLLQTEIEALLEYLAVPRDTPAMAAWEREFGLPPTLRLTIRKALNGRDLRSVEKLLLEHLQPHQARQALLRLEEISWRLDPQGGDL
jgi:hypothetical protein